MTKRMRGIRQYSLVMLMPSTSLSLTARSTVLRPSFIDSVAVFCSWMEVVKDARGRVLVMLEVAIARGTVANRRAVASVRKDIVVVMLVFVMRVSRWNRLIDCLLS